MEQKSRKPFTFRSLRIPENIEEGNLVEITGIYTQVYTYPNRKGPGYYTHTPLIVGKNLLLVEKRDYLVPIVGGISALVLIFIVWASLSERKRAIAFEQRMKEMKERRKKKRADNTSENMGKDVAENVPGKSQEEISDNNES